MEQSTVVALWTLLMQAAIRHKVRKVLASLCQLDLGKPILTADFGQLDKAMFIQRLQLASQLFFADLTTQHGVKKFLPQTKRA